MKLVLLSSLILSLSFSRFDAGVAAWVGLLPLFFSLEGKSPRQSFLLSYLCGFLFFLITLYWLIHVTPAGWIGLCLYLALYFGLFGLIFSIFKKAISLLILFALPSVWVLLEYLRSHLLTGFGWALLGYSQYKFLPVIQIADIFGALGVSFLVAMGNAAIYLILKR
ncbi:MAG: apolipoprotein N-acyltransferase, partial [Candidatus Omnitrophota bacterium]